jgi:hypothetical protein
MAEHYSHRLRVRCFANIINRHQQGTATMARIKTRASQPKEAPTIVVGVPTMALLFRGYSVRLPEVTLIPDSELLNITSLIPSTPQVVDLTAGASLPTEDDSDLPKVKKTRARKAKPEAADAPVVSDPTTPAAAEDAPDAFLP